MGIHILTGLIRNISAATNFHHQFLGGTSGQLDPEYGFHITGLHVGFLDTIWTISHLEDLLENREYVY